MANIKSSQKRIRVTRKKTERNKHYKSRVKTEIKKFEKALKNQDLETAKEQLRQASKIIDKATSKGVFHKNAAARKKSQLHTQLNQHAQQAS